MHIRKLGSALILTSSLVVLSMVPLIAAADEAHPHGSRQHDMKMTGDQDHDFATMMRKHHNDAVVMSEKELKDGRDPEMKAMAQKIITAQKKEIDELDKWLATHKPSASGEKK
jgi:uncharacterized protein (DUF305 family)